MKKRKFFSLFAILFVVVFALSCCFIFACNKDDSTEPEDTGTTQDPGTTDPGTTDPGTTDPGTTDPGTTDPGTTAIDSRIVLRTGDVELNENSGITYANPDSETLYIAETVADDDGNVTYTLAGTASFMDEDQADDFWAGHAAPGDAYIVITVLFEEDETVSWIASSGETRERTINEYPEGKMDVIIRISGTDVSEEKLAGTATYTITDSENNAVAHTVNFADVVKTQETQGDETAELQTEYRFDFDKIEFGSEMATAGKDAGEQDISTHDTAFYLSETSASTSDDDSILVWYSPRTETTGCYVAPASGEGDEYDPAHLVAGGKTQSKNSVYGAYFLLDLSDYADEYSMKISFDIASGYATDTRHAFLMAGNKPSNSGSSILSDKTDYTDAQNSVPETVLYYAQSKSNTDRTTESVSDSIEITSDACEFVIMCNANVSYYGISITLTTTK